MKKILAVFGTRPEAIKMAPVILELLKYPDLFECKVCVTGQHRLMLDQVLNLFNIEPHYDLAIMGNNQSLTNITWKILQSIEPVIINFKPDLILVHGDTTTTFAASLAAYYQKVSVGHIEAGLRTHNKYSPWPEEVNRQLTSVISTLHFAPTFQSKTNLLKEGIKNSNIFVTGNTVIDALFSVVRRFETDFELSLATQDRFNFLDASKHLILVTGHRRESFGEGFESICNALKKIVNIHQEVEIVFPVHLNPSVREPVMRILGNVSRVYLIEPQEYHAFVYLMNRSYFIITDSGGVQEEAPALGKPVLVMRDSSERPEAIDAGIIKLVGANTNGIFSEASKLINDLGFYKSMSKKNNIYGDGMASNRIVNALKSFNF